MNYRIYSATAIILSTLLTCDAEAARRSPIPTESAQTEALDLIKEVYKADYEAAKTNEQKAALAKKMLADSEATKDSSNRYVLLRVAKDISAQAGDVDTALAAIEQLQQGYEVDGLMMKASAIATASKEAKLPVHHQAVTGYLLDVIEQAVAADRYDLANNIGDVALASSRKARSSDVVKEVVAEQKRVEELAAAFGEVQVALDVLKDKPSDPEANLTVGKFRCFAKESWEAGIPMLALGSDEELKALAAKELADNPDALALGDGWWDVAESMDELAKTAARRRAAVWYEKALPQLEGLPKRKVEVRLADVQSTLFIADEDGWIDLLSFASPERVKNRTWQRVEQAIVVSKENSVCHLNIPITVSGSYELDVIATRKLGTGGIGIQVPVSEEYLVRAKIGEHSVGRSGLAPIREKLAYENETTITGTHVRNNVSTPIRMRVDVLDGDKVQVSVHLQGKQIIDWTGRRSDVQRESSCFGLYTNDSQIIFHSMKMRPVDGGIVQKVR